jgi:hypothetical protein
VIGSDVQKGPPEPHSTKQSRSDLLVGYHMPWEIFLFRSKCGRWQQYIPCGAQNFQKHTQASLKIRDLDGFIRDFSPIYGWKNGEWWILNHFWWSRRRRRNLGMDPLRGPVFENGFWYTKYWNQYAKKREHEKLDPKFGTWDDMGPFSHLEDPPFSEAVAIDPSTWGFGGLVSFWDPRLSIASSYIS